MKPLTATLLAAALSAAFSSAYAADTKTDTAAYRNMSAKATADYKAATANCKGLAGNDNKICLEEAKVARARAEADAVAQYNDTRTLRSKARTALANAEFALANVKCAVMTGVDKDNCSNNAKSVHTAALADAKADRAVRVADTASPVTGTATRDANKAAAVDKCAQAGGNDKTGCLIDNKGTATAIAKRTENAAQKTENVAERAVEKTKEAAKTVAAKTEHATDNLGDKSERAAEKTGAVVADSVITTKVKADLFKEPELKAMAIHVETEKGVVMLSGFVDNKAEADKAVSLAKSVEGVTSVKSAIKVK